MDFDAFEDIGGGDGPLIGISPSDEFEDFESDTDDGDLK